MLPTLMRHTRLSTPCPALSVPQFPHLQMLALEAVAESTQGGGKTLWVLQGAQQGGDCHEQPFFPDLGSLSLEKGVL